MNLKMNQHRSISYRASTLPKFRMAHSARPKDPKITDENENINNSSGSANRATSTPTNEKTNHRLNITNISDISFCRPPGSHLLPSQGSQDRKKKQEVLGSSGKKNQEKKKGAAKKDSNSAEIQSLLAYNLLLQSEVMKTLSERNAKSKEDEIDRSLVALKNKIIENERIINKTKENINQIKKCQELDNLLKERKNNSDNVVEKINKSVSNNVQKGVNKELEKMQNKLLCKGISIPQTPPPVIDKLQEMMKEAVASYEKLSKEPLEICNESKEICENLKQFKNYHDRIDEMHGCCSQILPSITSTVMEDLSNKISECEEEKVNENNSSE